MSVPDLKVRTPAGTWQSLKGADAIIIGPSATSRAITGSASVAFTTQAGLSLAVGEYVVAFPTATPANYMSGRITAYAGTALTVAMDDSGGSGTFADWTIVKAGRRGAAGVAGANGGTGPQGLSGPQGVVGPNGATGATGTNGTNGTNGTSPVVTGTSTTTLTVAVGSKTLTTQAGLAWLAGEYLLLSVQGTPTTNMYGTSTAYDPATGSLTITVEVANGTGSASVWNIQPTGRRGASGAAGVAGPTGGAGATGATGATGPAGADSTVAGPQGPQGATGPSGGGGGGGGAVSSVVDTASIDLTLATGVLSADLKAGAANQEMNVGSATVATLMTNPKRLNFRQGMNAFDNGGGEVQIRPEWGTGNEQVPRGDDARFNDARTPLSHSHSSTQITDFSEAVQDAVAVLLAAGTGVTLSYNDAANSLTITGTAGGGGLDAEAVRDAIGVALLGAGLVTVTVNDAADTITISTTATQNSTDAALRDRTTHTGTQPISSVSSLQTALDAKSDMGHSHPSTAVTDFAEAVDDRVDALLVAGANIIKTYDDTAGTMTLAATGATGVVPAYLRWSFDVLPNLYAITTQIGARSYATYTCAAGSTYFLPITFPVDTTIDALGIEVRTAIAGSLLMAIWNSEGDVLANKRLRPRARASVVGSSIDTSSTGHKLATLGMPFVCLARQVYFIAIRPSAAVILSSFTPVTGIFALPNASGLNTGAMISSTAVAMTMNETSPAVVTNLDNAIHPGWRVTALGS